MAPEQVRAARNWLGWTQQELATKAQVGLSTVKEIEIGSRKKNPSSILSVRMALEAAGIVFGVDSVSGPIAQGTEQVGS